MQEFLTTVFKLMEKVFKWLWKALVFTLISFEKGFKAISLAKKKRSVNKTKKLRRKK